jgi:NAD(P)H dehydrogenase (quinone)
MSTIEKKPRILIIGATGQVGRKTIDYLLADGTAEVIAAVRSPEKALQFQQQGINTVLFDYDNEWTHLPALKDIGSVFMLTGYTVDMLIQSKVFIDNARNSTVKHIVHVGACGDDNIDIGHLGWHQMIERYIEWAGFSYTHLRPEIFMQNLLSYGGKRIIENGVIDHYIGDAVQSWVNVDDIALIASICLLNPSKYNKQTLRLGYEALSYHDIIAMMTQIIGKPFKYHSHDPEEFRQLMIDAGAEMAYMNCVTNHYRRLGDGTLSLRETFNDEFFQITGKKPKTWRNFIEANKAEFNY